jgi:exodeoxyribonuclease VII small subunit
MEQKPIETMTYEEALQELEKVVSSLESGSVALDKSIDLYTRGSLLKDHCQKRLISAEEKISQIISNGKDSKIQLAPIPMDPIK